MDFQSLEFAIGIAVGLSIARLLMPGYEVTFLDRGKLVWRVSRKQCQHCPLTMLGDERKAPPPTLSAAMELPEVRALTHAVASQLTYMDMCGDHGDLYNRLKAALAAIKEPKL